MKYTVLLFLLLTSTYCFSQNKTTYPYKIKQGMQKVVEPKTFDVWVLKESQFDKALTDSKLLVVYKKQVKQLEEKIKVAKEKDLEQKQLIETVKTDRDYYKKIWKTTDEDLTKTAKKLKREVRRKRIYRIATFVSLGAVVVLALLI